MEPTMKKLAANPSGGLMAVVAAALACAARRYGWQSAPAVTTLRELVSGRKTVVAVIQFEGQQFLVGGSAHSVNLLARLGESPDFSELLMEWCERQR